MLDTKTTNELAKGIAKYFTFIIKDKSRNYNNGFLQFQCVAKDLKTAITKLRQDLDVDFDRAEYVEVYSDKIK